MMDLNVLRLSAMPNRLFESDKSERGEIVAVGRLLMQEANGRETGRVRTASGLPGEFTSAMDEVTYKELAASHRKKLMNYCARLAMEAEGRTFDGDEKALLSRSLMRNPVMLRVLSGVIEDIVAPVLPYVMSNAVGLMAQVVSVPPGKSQEVTVYSNDVLVFEDTAHGAVRSVSKGRLYNDTVTLVPRPKAASASLPWYQLVSGSVDIGLTYNAILAGLYAAVMGMYAQAQLAASEESRYTPAYLRFSTYNSDNLATLLQKTAVANRVPRNQLVIYGDFLALRKVLPEGTRQDVALTYGLGSEWNRNGYLGTVSGVPVQELMNAMVPGTVNTTGDLVMPTDMLWVAARPGMGYAPLYIAFEDGGPITVELEPSRTADMTLDITVSTSMDVKAVFGSKVGFMKNV